MLLPFDISCPYCGESIEVLVDASAGEQHYIEDCQVCCRPIAIGVRIDADGEPQVRAASENEA
ncbi:MAG: CPXCG motif-containing cysteine-rich protein [Rhodanobacter sp.]